MVGTKRWKRGDVIVQEGWNPVAAGKLIEVRPATVVEDTPRCLALYFAAGATYLSGDSMGGGLRRNLTLKERVEVFLRPDAPPLREVANARWHVLSLLPPGRMHAVWCFWDAGWKLSGLYVNLQAPYERTPRGIRIFDFWLDLAITPDLAWRWKDEDEFEAMCQHGVLASGEREAIRAEGEALISRIEQRLWPFDLDWSQWRPDPQWPIPDVRGYWRGVSLAP